MRFNQLTFRMDVVDRDPGGRPANHGKGLADLLALFRDNGPCTYAQIYAATGVPERTARDWLTPARDQNVVAQAKAAHGKPTRWGLPNQICPEDRVR